MRIFNKYPHARIPFICGFIIGAIVNLTLALAILR